MEGCSWRVWQCQLGTCSPTVPPAPSLAAGSGDRAHPAFQQDHPPHARLWNSPPLQLCPKLFIFTALSCVHEPHTQRNPRSSPCMLTSPLYVHAETCTNTQAHKHTHEHVCTQTCTKIPQAVHGPTGRHTDVHRNIWTHKLALGSTQPSWLIPRVRDKKAKHCPFQLNTLAKR